MTADEQAVLALLRRRPRTIINLLLAPQLEHMRHGLRLSPILVDMEIRGLVRHTTRTDGRWLWHAIPERKAGA